MPAIKPPPALLDAAEIDRFEALFEQHLFLGGGMSLEAADGFFSAMFVSPVQVSYETFVEEVWGGVDRGAIDAKTRAEIEAALLEVWRHVGRRISTPPDALGEHAVPLAHLSDAVVEAIQSGTLLELDPLHEAVGVEWAQGFLHGVSMEAEAWYERMESNEQIEFDLADAIELAELGSGSDPEDDDDLDDLDLDDDDLEEDDRGEGLEKRAPVSAADDDLLEAVAIDDFVEQQARISAGPRTDEMAADGDSAAVRSRRLALSDSHQVDIDEAAAGFDADGSDFDDEDEPLEPLSVLDCLDFLARAPIMLHDMHLLRMEEERPAPAKRDDLPGRNDPCSCGSGKKFKKCCGDPARLH